MGPSCVGTGAVIIGGFIYICGLEFMVGGGPRKLLGLGGGCIILKKINYAIIFLIKNLFVFTCGGIITGGIIEYGIPGGLVGYDILQKLIYSTE